MPEPLVTRPAACDTSQPAATPADAALSLMPSSLSGPDF